MNPLPEPDSTRKCPHFAKLPLVSHSHSRDSSFIKPCVKGWICLYDGCHKKSATHKAMKQQLQRFEPSHRVFMEMSRLEIYCFSCDIEITDEHEEDALDVRLLGMERDQNQDRLIFGANVEYSQAFRREKIGLVGTMGREINSYINSAIQLLAHLPPLYQIASEVNLETVSSLHLRKTIEVIDKIRSGAYRIVETKQIQSLLKSQFPNFHSYSHKSPSSFIFNILKSFSSEFQYYGPSCRPGQKLLPAPLQALRSPQTQRTDYSPTGELFSGNFLFELICSHCRTSKKMEVKFECINCVRTDTNHNNDNVPCKLQQLIDISFDYSRYLTPESEICQKFTCTRRQCQSKESAPELNHLKSKVRLPNILLLDFGSNIEGLNVSCPDVLDLTEYAEQANSQYVYTYVGCIGKVNKKYVTHVRQIRDGVAKYYIFDDAIIREETVQRPNRLKMAVYKLEQCHSNKSIVKNINSSVIVGIENYVPLPDFWVHYLAEHQRVQPMINPFICRHGFLRPEIKSKSKTSRKVPVQIYNYLVEKFGGLEVRITKENQYCPTCLERLKLIKEIKQSEKQMAKFADGLSNKKSKVYIDLEWFQRWKKYLYGDKEVGAYSSEGFRRPGPINNRRGLKQKGEINESMYRKVSPEVWYYFHKFYGGGPVISMKIEKPSLALAQAVDLRYDKVKVLTAKVYGETVRQQKKQQPQIK